jgi:hypothetical protein
MQIVRVIETRKNTLLTVHLSCSSPSRNDEITTSADSSSKKTSCIHKDGQDFSKDEAAQPYWMMAGSVV